MRNWTRRRLALCNPFMSTVPWRLTVEPQLRGSGESQSDHQTSALVYHNTKSDPAPCSPACWLQPLSPVAHGDHAEWHRGERAEQKLIISRLYTCWGQIKNSCQLNLGQPAMYVFSKEIATDSESNIEILILTTHWTATYLTWRKRKLTLGELAFCKSFWSRFSVFLF